MFFRKAALLAAAFWIALAGSASAQRAPFNVLNPPQPTEADRIEVIEFFWYGCPHCYTIEPSVASWVKSAPKDVVFKRVPAASSGGWVNLAAVFYTIEAMGVLDQYHGKVFDAIHKQNTNLGNEKVRDEWLAKQGLDPAKYKEVEKSFAVMTRIQRAKQMSASYKVDSVPQFVVSGKYAITSESAGGQDRMMQAVDLAIATARREKTAAAPAAPASLPGASPAGTAKR